MSFITHRLSKLSIKAQNLLLHQKSSLSLKLEEGGDRPEIFNHKRIRIQNACRQTFYEKQLLYLEGLIAVMNVLAFSITAADNLGKLKGLENEEGEGSNPSSNGVTSSLSLASVCALAVIFNWMRFKVKGLLVAETNRSESLGPQPCWKEPGEGPHESYKNQIEDKFGRYIPFLLQSLFYLAHPSVLTRDTPFLSQPNQPTLNLNRFLSCVVYLKFITTLLYFLKLSKFYGSRVNRVVGLYLGEVKKYSILYTLKAFLKQYGLKSPFILYGCAVFLLPFFTLTLQQSYLSDPSGTNQSSFEDHGFLQAIYDILITMTTVGYGDMKHSFQIQRVVIILVIVLGSFTSSFFTLTFLQWFQLTEQQEKSFSAMKRLSIKTQICQLSTSNFNSLMKVFIQIEKQKDRIHDDETIASIKPQGNCNWHLNDQIQTKASWKPFKRFATKHIKNPRVKSLKQELLNEKNTFKQTYEKNSQQLNHSIKLLIEKTLLTNNLLEFYLIRQIKRKAPTEKLFRKGNHSMYNSDSSQSSIKHQKRVNDTLKIYECKVNIIAMKAAVNQNLPERTQK